MNFVDFLFEGKTDSPDTLIIKADDEFSYVECYSAISRISSYLLITFGSEKEIVLLADNSFFFIVAYLGIIKSGNIAIVLDTKSSDEDIKKVISRCSPVAGFFQEQFITYCPNTLKSISDTDLDIIPDIQQIHQKEVPSDNCAVIIFTSGSTGVKKGVMLSHKNLIANTKSIIKYLNLSSSDRMCVVLPFYYCYGASLLHTHIRAGGSIVLAQSIFLGSVLKTINTYACTGFAGVPSTYQILILKTPFLKSPLPSLRYFTQAGGHLADHYIQQIVTAFPVIKFYVMYGATEATARLSYLPPEYTTTKKGSIGKGIPDVELEVHDEEGKIDQTQEIGEIVARGDNIMLGYYNDPQGTHEVIRNGWYHTGDLGVQDDDGFIYITGRKGTFIKSAGFRVSPLEIEDIILEIPGVMGCAVTGTPHDIQGEAIIACVQSEFKNQEYKKDILNICRKKLPTHKVPVDIIFVDHIPLNSSGKVDRPGIKESIKGHLMDHNTVFE